MKIRKANREDAEAVAVLLEQLGYPGARVFLAERINSLADDSNEELIVGEDDGRVIAVLSLHFIPQLAVAGPFARVSYLCVHDGFRNRGFGRQLEEYAEASARTRGCDRMELHSHARRTDAHRFYFRQGYEESPKYLIKRLTCGSNAAREFV
jgi:GNAT superfamily N-acetyltransferase